MFKVEFSKGGSSGPNFIVTRNGRFVAYIYDDAKKHEDFQALLEKIGSAE